MTSFSNKIALFESKSSNTLPNNNENNNSKNTTSSNKKVEINNNPKSESLKFSEKKNNNNDSKNTFNIQLTANNESNVNKTFKNKLSMFESKGQNNEKKPIIKKDLKPIETNKKENDIKINNKNNEKEKYDKNDKKENKEKRLSSNFHDIINQLNSAASNNKKGKENNTDIKKAQTISNTNINRSNNNTNNTNNITNKNSLDNSTNNKNIFINNTNKSISNKAVYNFNNNINKNNSNNYENNLSNNKNTKIPNNDTNKPIKTNNIINNKSSITTSSINEKKNITNDNNVDSLNQNLNINKISEEKIDNPPSINKTPSNTPSIQSKISFNNPNPINISGDKEEIGEIFLPSNLIPETVVNDTFCMAFFIASFNLENPKIIENSTELCSDCGHNLCTSGTAISSEIIFRYPKDDTKDFEISDLSASICFPNGIKICVDKIESHVKTLKNYSSILTNQNGKRYYMMTYHYYTKIKSEELNHDNEYYNSLNEQLINAINSNGYIYIPYCMCLLSKYPFFNQMEKCLESMRFSLENHKSYPEEIYNFITYFIKSIPIPPLGSKLFFPLPYYSDLLSIFQPVYKDIFLFGDNPIVLLEYLSVEEIIIIFRLLIFEQKTLIIGNNYDAIAQVTYNLILLLYPLQWVHTYISIMTEKMLKYLQSFLPFFNGMHISLYELTSGILENIKENIFIFNINTHNFEMNTFPDLNSKSILKKINEIVPQLPKNIYNVMSFGLGVMKSYYDKKKEMKNFNINNIDEILPINIKIKQAFTQVFIEILYDYKEYLSVIEGKPIFNTNALLEKRPKNESNFYKEFTETQLFQMFIQNNQEDSNIKDRTVFEEHLNIYQELKVKTDFREEYINYYQENCDIYKHYIIKRDILDNFDKNNKKKINVKNEEEFTLADYKKFVKQKNFIYETYFNPNSILKSNKKVIKNKIILELNKMPDKYNFYIIPNQEFNFEVEKRKKSVRIKRSNDKNNANKVSNGNIKELSQEQKDEIKENIVDPLTKIFKNEEVSNVEQSKKLIMDSLNTDYGRDLYSNILYQNNNISNDSSFKFLNDIIYNSVNKILKLKLPKDKMIFYCAKLIKSCQNFKKEENRKLKYLSDILYPKFQKVQIVNELEFWKQWALLQNSDNKVEKDENKKWVESLKNIEETLPKFGFKKTMIYSTVADLGKDNITDETLFLGYMREVVMKLKIFH